MGANRRLGRWVLLLSVVCAPSARADAPPPSAGDYAVARALYQRGTQHYRLTEYAQALADFTEAYRVVPQAALLYNIAQSHRELGHLDEALKFYRSYLGATRASDPERPSIELRVRELEATIADRDSARREAARLALERDTDLARTRRLQAELTLKLADRPRGTPRSARSLMWAGVGVLVAGVVLAIAGTAPALSAHNARLDLQASAAQRSEYDPAQQTRIDRADLGAGLMFSIGGAVAVSGGTMLGIGAARARRWRAIGESQ